MWTVRLRLSVTVNCFNCAEKKILTYLLTYLNDCREVNSFTSAYRFTSGLLVLVLASRPNFLVLTLKDHEVRFEVIGLASPKNFFKSLNIKSNYFLKSRLALLPCIIEHYTVIHKIGTPLYFCNNFFKYVAAGGGHFEHKV